MTRKLGICSSCSQNNNDIFQVARCCMENCDTISDKCYSYTNLLLDDGNLTKEKYDEYTNRCSITKKLCYEACTFSDNSLLEDPMEQCFVNAYSVDKLKHLVDSDYTDDNSSEIKRRMIECCLQNCDGKKCKDKCELFYDINKLNIFKERKKHEEVMNITRRKKNVKTLNNCDDYSFQFLWMTIGLFLLACSIGFRILYIINKTRNSN